MRSILVLRKTSRSLESSRGNEQVILSDGGVAAATPRAEKSLDCSSGEPGDAGILCKTSICSRFEGFTLVEILVAIAISAIFIGAVTTLIIQNSRMAQRTRDVAVTNSFAENKIEALRSAGFLTLTDGTTNITNELPSELQASRNATLTISSMSTAVKKIDLAVLYNDLGSAKSYSYTTYIGELGVGQY